MSTVVLLPVSLMVVLAGALLFTNAIEWLGAKLELAQGAVGSLLAAVATALPESLIPITAVVRGGEGSDEVATGAILGAPFLLATLAMGLVGLSAYLWRRRRPQGVGLAVHFPTLERDLAFFMGCFGFAFLLGVIGVPEGLRMVAAVALVLAYVRYVRLTLNNCGEVEPEAELPPLLMDRTRGDPPTIGIVLVQSSSRSARLWGSRALRRGDHQRGRGRWRRAAPALARDRPLRHRATREGQQRLLGA